MRLSAVPLLPEIRLHAPHAGSGLSRRRSGPSGAPYWAYAWAGGIALARYLLDHPDAVAGLRVLDVGTGSGLAAIAAAKAGARSVTAVDIDADAVNAARLNAAANGVVIDALEADIAALSAPQAEMVLAGDLFYSDKAARVSTPFLEACRAAGARVLVGDPDRKFLPRERLGLLATYPIADFGSAAMAASGNVYEFG